MRKYLLGLLVAPLLLANSNCEGPKPTAQQVERAQVSANQDRLVELLPAPILPGSLERQNLINRLKRVNAQNMQGCIYMISYGRIMAMYPVKGKISSLNSFLAGSEKPERDRHGDSTVGSLMVEQPDFDGAYGKNDDGIFFFTADTDSYVEYKGEYMFTDQCLKMSQEPMLVREVK